MKKKIDDEVRDTIGIAHETIERHTIEFTKGLKELEQAIKEPNEINDEILNIFSNILSRLTLINVNVIVGNAALTGMNPVATLNAIVEAVVATLNDCVEELIRNTNATMPVSKFINPFDKDNFDPSRYGL